MDEPAKDPIDTTPAAFFELEGLPFRELFDDVSTPWDALGATLKRFLRDAIRPGIRGEVQDGAILVGDEIELGEGSVVEPGAYVKGPCIIGRDVEIRHGAYVRG